MPTWKIFKGADALYEGTVTFATIAGADLAPYDLNGGTLTWHMGSTLQPPGYTRSSASGTNFAFTATSSGVYNFSMSPADTESLLATSYYFDIWLKTSGLKEYCLTVGTLIIKDVVGTI